jgi:hypothetical protein
MLMRAQDDDNYGKKVAEKSIKYRYQKHILNTTDGSVMRLVF